MSTSSSNSTKKKQEEKNLKTLREFLALSSNKTCFDCNQRGPTYVNTTMGSFVCISCSGKLRGLTPPHRVKSVTMASFTQDEIDFLRNRGNEYCRLVWMSHYNMADLVSETKDDHKFKDHLIAKYEKKRWYTDPGAIPSLPSGMTKANGIQGTILPQATPMPSVTHSPVARPSASVAVVAVPSKSSDLLADLDFFTAAPPVVSTANMTRCPSPRSSSTVNVSIPQSASQPSFANFNNADFFFSGISPQKGNVTPQPLVHHAVNGFGVVSPPKEAASVSSTVPPEDRYSALKDLDALFTTATSSNSVIEPVVSASGVPSSTSSSSAWIPTWVPSGDAGPTTAPSVSHPSVQNDSSFGNSLERWDGATGFQAAATQQHLPNSSNPFLSSSPAPTGAQPASGFGCPVLPWASFSTSPTSGFGQPSGPNINGAGLFPGITNPVSFNSHNHSAMMVNTGGGVMAGLSTSQSLDLSPKTWGNASASTMNPFVGTAGFSQGRSHNPFL